jgi:hypothetical protein
MKVPSERAARLPQPVRLAKVLLVEGETPLNFFDALTRHLGLSSQIEIRSYGGIDDLTQFLSTFVTTTEFKTTVKTLGIVRDAEDNAGAARQSIEAVIAAANVPQGIAVRSFLLPDNTDAGMIETLMQQSVANTPLFGCVHEFFRNTPTAGFTLPAGVIAAKHRVQAYLAARDDIQVMPGIAASRGAFPFAHAAFQPISDFLRSL